MNSLRLSLPGSIDTDTVVSVLRRLLADACPPRRPTFSTRNHEALPSHVATA
jgi:hypothetical protein